MRLPLLAVAAVLLSAPAAVAAPASVNVAIGPELQHKAEQKYGVRELKVLADDLQDSVQKALARTGAYDDARIELTIVDARPNRPTFEELGHVPGLSPQSFSVGGAKIEGRILRRDGSVQPVSYRWYETDIREAYASWTWSDAAWAFDRLARRLAKGDELASR